MISKKIKISLASLATLVAIVGCENDFSEVGSDLPNNDEFSFEIYKVNDISSSNAFTGEVNVRDLPINSIGYFNHSIFGARYSHLVTQVKMDKPSSLSNLGANPQLDSVYVYMPFNSKIQNVSASQGTTDYELNGVYGEGTFHLKVYENGYLLNSANPDDGFNNQFYYSSQKPIFDAQKGTTILNNSTKTSQNTAFKFDKEEIVLYKYDENGNVKTDKDGNPEIASRKSPGVWLDLDKNYFQQRFFDNNTYQTLTNNALFSEYFRGLYFEVTQPNGNALAQFDLSNAKMVFVLRQDKANGEGTERKEIVFNMGHGDEYHATSVNLFENPSIASASDLMAAYSGKLLLTGGDAFYGKITLFQQDADGNGIPDELEQIKSKNWLINEAILTFSVDASLSETELDQSPYRLFLYDFKNNKPLVDYTVDLTTKPMKNIYGGILNKEKRKYQFRITEYIKQLIEKESDNYELGIVVANDITDSKFNKIKDEDKQKIPTTSTTFPFGTILSGANDSDSNQRIQLEIFYTNINE